MEDRMLYSEVQSFTRQPVMWVTWIIFAIVILVLHFQGQLVPAATFILGAVTLAGVYLMFYGRLETRIEKSGIQVKLRPFLNHWKTFRREEIRSAEVRKYKPIREFGGWGIRFGRNSQAFNISGDLGLELTLENGKKIMIGTQNPDAIQAAASEMLEG